MRLMRLIVLLCVLFVACEKNSTPTLEEPIAIPDSISLPVKMLGHIQARLGDTDINLGNQFMRDSIYYNDKWQLSRIVHRDWNLDDLKDSLIVDFDYQPDGKVSTMKGRTNGKIAGYDIDVDIFYSAAGQVDSMVAKDPINNRNAHWVICKYNTDGRLVGYTTYKVPATGLQERYKEFDVTFERNREGDSITHLLHGKTDISEVLYCPDVITSDSGYINSSILLFSASIRGPLLSDGFAQNTFLYQFLAPKEKYLFRNFLNRDGRLLYDHYAVFDKNNTPLMIQYSWRKSETTGFLFYKADMAVKRFLK